MTNTFQQSLELWLSDQPDLNVDLKQIARIASVNRDNYTALTEFGEIQAEITGKMMFAAESPLDYPAVGDWVRAEFFNNNTLAMIHEILPRKTLLKRKEAGQRVEYQPIAANIDIAFIMQAVDRDFNVRRLERYLVMILETGIKPAVLLNKTDLIDEAALQDILLETGKITKEIPVMTMSNETGAGLAQIESMLKPGYTFCLLGSSGVGKTTWINHLIGEAAYKTGEIREIDHRGRHTTTRRQMIVLPNGALMIDTPGMKELGTFGMDEGFEKVFDEITELSQRCQFKDCTHIHEKGCAVLEALESGELDPARHQNYIKMKKESEHYSRSYLERRQRDKSFGKMVKSVLKDNTKRKHEKKY